MLLGTAFAKPWGWLQQLEDHKPSLTVAILPLQISVDNIVVRAICRLPNLECVEIPDCYSITNSALPDLGMLQGNPQPSLFPSICEIPPNLLHR